MGLFAQLFEKNKRYKIEDSGTLLLSLGKRRGLSNEKKDPMLAWAIFKEFYLEYHFQCDDDAVLWEIGPYGETETGTHCFQWHLVRQLTKGRGEDDDISQAYLNLTFSKEPAEERRASVWSYDFDGDWNSFFASIESRPDFSLPQGVFLRSASVGLEKV